MKVILTYGTFDLFHVGHVRLLKRLRQLGDKLIVGLSSDDFNTLKGKQTVMTFEQRKEILLSCRYVDDVFEESRWEQKRSDIEREKADIFAMGDDWAGKFDDLQDITKVVYLPRTEDVSTTEVKMMVKHMSLEKQLEIVHLLDMVKGRIAEL
ncbi:adenylyltransferase/cytidyltransferase family protein [Psychrobacter immobilis]|uniref:adenylyltransferase/cytidyltransferase family protein n=1 Tax=Psychrobacter immobilis TaxID=498 RepID=UPI00191A7BCE|nr:adenylyltransferase/cytidyltransferase family protein [Psychrobacter immobilis]